MSYTSRKTWIPWGDAGIWATLQEMRRIAQRGARKPLLQAQAARIVQQAGSTAEAARRVRAWLENATRFEHDPADMELVRTPAVMLREIERTGVARGDCDDVATLAAALGLGLGFPVRFAVVGFQEDGPLSHVYAELWTPEGWADMDTTLSAQAPPGITEQRRYHLEL